MSRERKSQPTAKSRAREPAEPAPQSPLAPPRKRPAVLALAGILLVAWIGFLIAMAFRG